MNINDIDDYQRVYDGSNELLNQVRDPLNRELGGDDDRPLTDSSCREGVSSDIRKISGKWGVLYTGELTDAEIAQVIKQILTDAGWSYQLADDDETLLFTLTGPDDVTLQAYYDPRSYEDDSGAPGRWITMRIETNCLDVSDDVREHIQDNDL